MGERFTYLWYVGKLKKIENRTVFSSGLLGREDEARPEYHNKAFRPPLFDF